jgi:mono/diheme cytochrome c family protein
MRSPSRQILSPSGALSGPANPPARRTLLGASWLIVGLVAGWTAVPFAEPVQAASRESREAGAALFHKTGCEFCHGLNGVGTERAPDLSSVGKRKKRPQIEQQILHGGNGMPAFGAVLQPDEVQLLVDYLSAKRKARRR